MLPLSGNTRLDVSRPSFVVETRVVSAVNGPTWSVSLGSRQAKLFRLGSGSTSATGPTNQALVVASSTTLSTVASGTPPFTYTWRKNGVLLSGQNESALTINPTSVNDAGLYAVQVNGGFGNVTNNATISLLTPTNLTAQLIGDNLMLNWPIGHTGWRLQSQTNDLITGINTNWQNISGSETTNRWSVPLNQINPTVFFRLTHP